MAESVKKYTTNRTNLQKSKIDPPYGHRFWKNLEPHYLFISILGWPREITPPSAKTHNKKIIKIIIK